jgi:Zn-dependent alcohol dehydrogenase
MLTPKFRYAGAATVIKLCKATSSDTVVVTGLGAVGLAAIMAAKIAGCKNIVGIDRVETRLNLAIDLGATAVINTSDVDIDVGLEVKKLLNGGPSIAIDATGHLALIKQAYQFTGRRGKLVVVGASGQDAKLDVPLGELMGVSTLFQCSV